MEKKQMNNSPRLVDYEFALAWYQEGLRFLEVTIRCYEKGRITKEQLIEVMQRIKQDKGVVKKSRSNPFHIPL